MEHYLGTLERTIRRDWNGLALCNYQGEQFTFRETAEKIERFHLIFEKAGIRKGDKIAICATNSARWAITFLSVTTYGTVIVPLLADFHPENVNTLVDHSESVLLFTDKEIFKKLDTEKMPKLKGIINNADYSLLWSRDEALSAAMAGIEDDFKAKYPAGLTPDDVKFKIDNQKELACINYTSGTTSAPKGVMLRHECFSGSVDFATRKIPCSNKDSIVSMLPMGHIYGLVFEFLYPLCNGVTVYYLGKTPAASTLLKAMAEIKPYIVITVPLVMEKIYKSSIKPVLEKPAVKLITGIPGINRIIYNTIKKKLLSSFGGNVCQFIMGGAALNPDVENVFRKMKFPYTVGYGMTEAAPLLAYSCPEEYKKGSCGRYVDFAEVRIDSEDPENIPGEIQAKGINICSGYFNNPQASAGAFTEDGFLHTGDLGVMDKDGNITIRGRSKNMILSSNGQNIFPEEIEAVINSQNFVADSVVLSRASKLVALVHLDKDGIKKSGLTDEDIHDMCDSLRNVVNKKLPSYSRITKLEFVETPFEKTPKGSIKRFMYK